MSAELRDRLKAAAASPRSDPDLDDVRRRAARIRQRRSAAVAAAAVVVLVLPGVLLALPDKSPSVVFDERSVPEPEPIPAAPGSWAPMSRAPIEGRIGASATWTGSEVLIWGGGPARDGAVYEPATDSWRLMAAAPFDGRRGHAAVWTGEELLVWGGYTVLGGQIDDEPAAGGAAYRPATDTWRTLAPEPENVGAAHAPIATWSGSEMLAAGLEGIASYDPTTDNWRMVTDMPALGGMPVGAWSGRDELLLLHGHQGWLYRATEDTWEELSGVPGREFFEVVWKDMEAVVLGGTRAGEPSSEVVAYAPAIGSWRSLPDLPRAQRQGLVAESRPGALFAVGGGDDVNERAMSAWVYDASNGAWHAMDSPLDGRGSPAVVVAGDRLVVWSGMAQAVGDETAVHDDGAMWRFEPGRWPVKGPPPELRAEKGPAPGLRADFAVDGRTGNEWEITAPATFTVHVQLHQPAEELRVALVSASGDQRVVRTQPDPVSHGHLEPGAYRFRVEIEVAGIPPGRYRLVGEVRAEGGVETHGLGIVIVD